LAFEEASSTMLCDDELFENGYTVESCKVFAQQQVAGASIEYLLLKYN
jgi:hypothetical protein